MLYNYSHGIDDSPVIPYYIPRNPSSIGRSKTISRKGTTNIDKCMKTLNDLSSLIATEVKYRGYYFKTVSLELHGYRNDEFDKLSRSKTLFTHSNKKKDIYSIVREKLFYEQRINPRKIVKLGVRVSNLTKEPQLGFDFGDL